MINDNTYNIGMNNQEFYADNWMNQPQFNEQFDNSQANLNQMNYYDENGHFDNQNFEFSDFNQSPFQPNFGQGDMPYMSEANNHHYDQNQNYGQNENFNDKKNFPKNKNFKGKNVDEEGITNDNNFKDHWWFATFLYQNGQVKKKGRICSTKGYIIAAIALIVLILLIVFWNSFSKNLLPLAGNFLKDLMKKPTIVWVLLIGGGLTLLACIPFPGLNTAIILIAFAMHKWFVSVIFTWLCQLLASVIVYFVTRYCWKECFHKRFEQNVLYQMIIEESKLKPFSFTLMIRFVEVLESVKNVMIALGPVDFKIFILTNVVYNFLQSCFYCYIGVNLSNINDFIGGKSFSEKSGRQKMTTVFTYLMMSISGGIMVYICCYTRKRIKKFKKKQKKKEIHKIQKRLIHNNINPKKAMQQWNQYVVNPSNQKFNDQNLGNFQGENFNNFQQEKNFDNFQGENENFSNRENWGRNEMMMSTMDKKHGEEVIDYNVSAFNMKDDPQNVENEGEVFMNGNHTPFGF